MDRTQFLAAIFMIATGGGICAQQTAPPPSPAEPFGLPLGASRAELEKLAGPLTEVGPGNFQLAKAPNPHPSLQDYQVSISPTYGLCTIAATSPSLQPNAFGDQVKSLFADLAMQLEGRYGKASRTVDRLTPGSIWNEANEWTMGLVQGERTLGKAWDNPAPGLSGLGLMAHPVSRFDVRVAVYYESTNAAACTAEAKERQAGVF